MVQYGINFPFIIFYNLAFGESSKAIKGEMYYIVCIRDSLTQSLCNTCSTNAIISTSTKVNIKSNPDNCMS